MRVPKAAPTPAGIGPKITAKREGITTAGLNWPAPQGEGIVAVRNEPIAYRLAHIDIKATFKERDRLETVFGRFIFRRVPYLA